MVEANSGYYWAPWSKGQGLSRDIVFTCVVLHNMRTHQSGADTAPTLTNDGTALENKQAVCVTNENYNPSREAKH